MVSVFVFFVKQKTAYEMRMSDWSSDVCSSDLRGAVEYKLPHDCAGPVTKQNPRDIIPRSDYHAGPQAIFRCVVWARFGLEALDPDLAGGRKSVEWGKSVSVRVALGGRRIIKNTKEYVIVLMPNLKHEQI